MDVVSLLLLPFNGFPFQELVWSLVSSYELLTSMMFFGNVLHESTSSHGTHSLCVCVCARTFLLHSLFYLFFLPLVYKMEKKLDSLLETGRFQKAVLKPQKWCSESD